MSIYTETAQWLEGKAAASTDPETWLDASLAWELAGDFEKADECRRQAENARIYNSDDDERTPK